MHKKNEKSLHVCTSILSYIDHSLVKIVHGHFSYNRIKFIYLTASKFTQTNTNVDALRETLMVQLVSPWNGDENRPAGLALEFEMCLDFWAASSIAILIRETITGITQSSGMAAILLVNPLSWPTRPDSHSHQKRDRGYPNSDLKMAPINNKCAVSTPAYPIVLWPQLPYYF